MRFGLALALAALLACTSGCGADAVGEELEGYYEHVVLPALAERDAGTSRLKDVFEKGAGDPYRRAAELTRANVIPPLERSHKMLLAHVAVSPLLKQANKLLTDEAEIAVQRMKDLANALEKRDETTIKIVLESCKTFDKVTIEILRDLHTLALKTNVRLKSK